LTHLCLSCSSAFPGCAWFGWFFGSGSTDFFRREGGERFLPHANGGASAQC
jgi:hypothetical protein